MNKLKTKHTQEIIRWRRKTTREERNQQQRHGLNEMSIWLIHVCWVLIWTYHTHTFAPIFFPIECLRVFHNMHVIFKWAAREKSTWNLTLKKCIWRLSIEMRKQDARVMYFTLLIKLDVVTAAAATVIAFKREYSSCHSTFNQFAKKMV